MLFHVFQLFELQLLKNWLIPNYNRLLTNNSIDWLLIRSVDSAHINKYLINHNSKQSIDKVNNQQSNQSVFNQYIPIQWPKANLMNAEKILYYNILYLDSKLKLLIKHSTKLCQTFYVTHYSLYMKGIKISFLIC